MNKGEIGDRGDERTIMNGKALASLIGKNKKERNAIETTYKHFHEFGKGQSRGESLNANIKRDISILTSVRRISDFVLGVFLVFVIAFVNFFLLFFLVPSTNTDVISANFDLMIILFIALIILDGICARIILFVIHLRDYYIILAPQGIYYKKVGKPKFFAWSDMTKIQASMRYMRTRYASTTKANDLVVKIFSNYDRVVRFRAINYIHVEEFSMGLLSTKSQLKYFADIFRISRYRQCPFFYSDKWERLGRVY
ncbi:MAG: hypothetical protein ACW98D_04965 [Promethearchaeota archaeon]|jgi:hypothetical protein